METEPVDGIEDYESGEIPEDVAILYSWANLQGAKYRDFSANRREYRAQMRHRAAEQLRLLELKAQSEAETAAAAAEAEAAAAHADADAATVRLAASRSMPRTASDAIQAEQEVEDQRRTSLREATQQARRAAAERLEAARRAEAAALADSIARREEREIAEAQASALRQAAKYAEADLRHKQTDNRRSENAIPGRISDPYSPQILAEGEYFETPGTPITELESSRFRSRRDYIERATRTELPPLRMPGGHVEDRLHTRAPRPSDDRDGYPLPGRPGNEEHLPRGGDFSPRKLPTLRREGLDIRGQEGEAMIHDRDGSHSDSLTRPVADAPRSYASRMPVSESHRLNPFSALAPPREDAEKGTVQRRAEVVDRISDSEARFLYKGDQADYSEQLDLPEPHWSADGFHDIARGANPNAHAEAESTTKPPQSNSLRGRLPATGLATDRSVAQGFVRPDRSSEGQGLAHLRGSETSFRGYPETNFGAASPYKPSEPLYRPDPSLGRTERERHSGPHQVARSPFAEDHWNDAFSETSPQPEEAIYSRSPIGRKQETSIALKPPDPEWLEAGADGQSGQQDLSPDGTKPHEEKREASDTLQSSREQIASRWFALRAIFAGAGHARPPAKQVLDDSETRRNAPLVAVFSIAGGVGKSTLVGTLGRTLSSLGEKVLLTDMAAHGLLPFYFGASEILPGVVRTFLPPGGSTAAPVHLVSYSNNVHDDNSWQNEVVEDLLANSQRVHRVLIDMDMNCRWLVENVARLQPTVLVPLSANMNSIVNLQSVERSFASIRDAEGEPLRPLYVLNQFDPSLPLHLDVREVLRHQLGDRLLPFVIRQAQGVSEALAEGMTIVDYDPKSVVAQDYLGLANWIRARSAAASISHRDLRWSER